jgi:hypothetical protein
MSRVTFRGQARSALWLTTVACSALLSAADADIVTSTPSGTRVAGRRFFQEHVLPRIVENGCAGCHAVGYVQPNVTKYEELLPYLAMGDAPEKTAVIRKIANLRAIAPDRPTHPGGQRCASLESEPCRSIIRWWAIEFGTAQTAAGVPK